MPSAAVLAGVPVELGRHDAARAAHEELSKQVYQQDRPGLVQRALGWLYHHLVQLLDNAAGASPGGYAGLAALLLLVLAAVVALRFGLGPVRGSDRASTALFGGRPRTAAEHRASAVAHEAAGRYAEAVRDRLRAIVTSLEERTLLEPRPGRTADEAAADAGAVVPDCAADLRAAARVFDDIWYGGRPATPANAEALRRLDERVRSARPVVRAGA